jgi:pentatricopeptide repeat protein
MLCVPATIRHRLLRAFGTPEKKDTRAMLRYFALIADVKNCGLALRRTEWNHALALASRYVGTVSDTEMDSTLRLWKEMERDAGVKGNDVTFHILFDVASKSGNFTLAEMIFKEMETRGFRFNRYHHVSLIHFFGLKMEGNGVRAAYKEMVDAGEMIDTVVLNCVISGLLKSGEDAAAEQVYERMKETHTMAPDLPERDYFTSKVITNVLMMFSKVGQSHPSMVQSFQKAALVAPDLQTYRILVNHFAVKVGNLGKVAQYLDEMKWFQVPLHGAVFLALFKGFDIHGSRLSSDWGEQRLQKVFSALLKSLDDGARGLYVDTWLGMYALKAFVKCSSREKVLEAYDGLQVRWKLNSSQTAFMADFLHKLLCQKTNVFEEPRGGKALSLGMSRSDESRG